MNAVVTGRTLLPFWRSVVHLVRFDLRRFRLFVALIVGLELAYAAFVEWSLHLAPVTIGGDFRGAFGDGESGFLGFFLGFATMLATAAIVQGDLPSDDRAFWRTRPIAPLALAAAKLVTFGLLFVVLPAVINAGRLAAYGAPLTAIAAATLQIFVETGTLVAFTWTLALATRTLPRFLAALGAIIVGGYVALAALAFWLMRGRGTVGFDASFGGGVELGAVAAIAFTVIALAILVAHYRLRRWRVAVVAGLVLIAAAVFLPSRSTKEAAPPALARLVDRPLGLPEGLGVPQSWFAQGSAGWPAYLTGRIEMPPVPPDVSIAVALRETHLVVNGRRIPVQGVEQCCGGRGPIGVVAPAGLGDAMPASTEPPILFGLEAPLVPTIVGRRIAVGSDVEVRFGRHRLVGAIPLARGAAFRTDRYLLEFLDLEPARRMLVIRFTRFPRLASGMTEGLTLFVADSARTRVITTTAAWRMAPANAASGRYDWAKGRNWSGRFQLLLTGLATPPDGAQLLIVETWPAGVSHTTLSATDLEVRAPRLE
jgi:hypothetical protein